MINLTSIPQLVDAAIPAPELDQAIRDAIQYAIGKEAEYYGAAFDTAPSKTPDNLPTFAYFFKPELKGTQLYDAQWIEDAYQFSQAPNARHSDTPVNMDSILLLHKRGPIKIETYNPAKGRTYIQDSPRLGNPTKSALKTALLYLWSRKIILLPLTFNMGTSIREDVLRELLTPVAAHFKWHPTENLQDRGLRIILTTDWHSFGSSNLDELSQLHVLTLTTVDGAFESIGAAKWPFQPMVKEFVEHFGTEVSFSGNEADLYQRWCRGKYFQKYTFAYFRDNQAEIEKAQRAQKSRANSARSRKQNLLRRQGVEFLEGITDFTRPAIVTMLEKIAGNNGFEAALEYFSNCSGLNRGPANSAPYPGREEVPLVDLARVWYPVIEGFLAQRRQAGYEDEQRWRQDLAVLCDYLFLVLPWWYQLYGSTARVAYPQTPADFTRHIFLKQDGPATEGLPPGFYTVAKLRRKTKYAFGTLVSTLNTFFEYCKAERHRFPELDGRTFDNPVVIRLDYPKKVRRGKTNKVPFKRQIMPVLLRYCYALEEFGMQLQKLAMAGTPAVIANEASHGTPIPDYFYPEQYGLSLTVEFNGKTYAIERVPNVFTFSVRTLQKAGGETITVDMPHCTAHRLNIGMLETGLRGQTVQWLNRMTWDSRNTVSLPGQRVFELFVNTDKVRAKPWVAPITYRARDVFLREQAFQEAIAEEGMDSLVPYAGRECSRFDPIVPLFRAKPRLNDGIKTSQPISDNQYGEAWVQMLTEFQVFYNEEVAPDGEYVSFVNLKPYYHKGQEGEGKEIVQFDPVDRTITFCPVRYEAIHTPHSARSSFISNRAGLLILEDIGRIVGQLNAGVTSHYTIEDWETLTQKVEATGDMLWTFDETNPVYVHADKINSAMRQAFDQDRDQAIARFGMQCISLLNGEDEESIQSGVELLRTTQASQIAWHKTHVCPVGDQCPKDFMDVIQEPRRCGLCPIAVKGLDHRTAINAKIHSLLEQVRNATELLDKWQEKVERGEVSEDEIQALDERRNLDYLEAEAWALALRRLNALEEETKRRGDASDVYIVEEPETVRRHLKFVSVPTGRTVYLIERIRDANEYVTLQTPELRAEAMIMRQHFLANLGYQQEALRRIPAGDEIKLFLDTVKNGMRTLGLSGADAQKLLEAPPEPVAAGADFLLPSATDVTRVTESSAAVVEGKDGKEG